MPIKKIKKLAAKAYNRIFPSYPKELERAVGECRSLLDVGCGENSPVRNFSRKPHNTGVDAFEPSIRKSKEEGLHDGYCKMDILEIGKKFKPMLLWTIISDLTQLFTKSHPKHAFQILCVKEKSWKGAKHGI